MTAALRSQSLLRILLVDDDPVEMLILKRKLSGVNMPAVTLDFADGIAAAVSIVRSGGIDLVLLDNRLIPNNDFRETAPQLRAAGFTGPIGIISSDINGAYFQAFSEYGADFRIGKDEIDARAIAFILQEYTRDLLPPECVDDFT